MYIPRCVQLGMLDNIFKCMPLYQSSAICFRFYKLFAKEMGFDEFHLHLRPVHFEFASHKEKADQPPPVFITALLEDDSTVDR